MYRKNQIRKMRKIFLFSCCFLAAKGSRGAVLDHLPQQEQVEVVTGGNEHNHGWRRSQELDRANREKREEALAESRAKIPEEWKQRCRIQGGSWFSFKENEDRETSSVCISCYKSILICSISIGFQKKYNWDR